MRDFDEMVRQLRTGGCLDPLQAEAAVELLSLLQQLEQQRYENVKISDQSGARLKLINDKLSIIDVQRDALSEAERFMAYFANETDGHFSGPGTPTTCLAEIRAALQRS